MSRRHGVVCAYRALVRILLPGPVRDRDADEIVATFAQIWSEARGRRARIRCLVRTFGRLPLVAVAEWRDHLASPPAGPRRWSGGGTGWSGGGKRWSRGGTGWSGGGKRWSGGGIGFAGPVLRPALAALRRSPAFACSAALLLGLGVGAVTTAFTIVDHLFLRPLPYPHAELLLSVNGSQSHPAFEDLRTLGSVDAWAAAAVDYVHLTGQGDPVRLAEARVTDGFFSLFGARPVTGRLLSREDFEGAGGVVISHGAWQRIWGAADDVVGRAIMINDEAVPVVGVLSPDFEAPEALLDGAAAEIWRPVDRSGPDADDRFSRSLVVVGRLAPGATLEGARREASALAEQRARTFPDAYVRRDGSVVELPVVSLEEATVGRARERFTLVGAAAALLLLVACVNVAHLFMARGLARARDMAVRRALGAGRAALAAQMLIETVLIAAAGCGAGVALAAAGMRTFLALDPQGLPRASAVTIDGRVLAFCAAMSVLTAVVFGLLPALRAARAAPGDVLRRAGRSATGDRGARRVREGLVTAEVALSVVLVFCAGLLTRTFLRLADEPLGFGVADVWTIRVGLPEADREEETAATAVTAAPLGAGAAPVRDAAPHWSERMDRMVHALRATPGVRSVAYGLSAPLEHIGGTCCWSRMVSRPGSGEGPEAMIHPYAGAYAEVFEPRVLAGRSWTFADERSATPPAMLNERLARGLFGSPQAAIGARVALGSADHLVIGVVAEDRHYGLYRQHGPAAYVPMRSLPFDPDRLTLAVRVASGLDDVARRLRDAIWSVEPLLPLPLVRPMDEWADAATARARFDGWLFTSFAAAALLLAAGGIFGTLYYTVGLARRELGIRLALGARRRKVEAGVVARALRMTGVGLGMGSVAAWGGSRALESRLFGTEAYDPVTLIVSIAVILSTAVVASWLPARSAGAVDPVAALREE